MLMLKGGREDGVGDEDGARDGGGHFPSPGCQPSLLVFPDDLC